MTRSTSKSKNSTQIKSAGGKTKKVVKNTKTTIKPTKVNRIKPLAKKNLAIKNGKKIKTNKGTNKGAKTKTKATKKAVKSSPHPKKVSKQKITTGPKGYTADQYLKFLSEKKRLNSLSNQQLKDTLRKNLQSMSGNKDDLVYKVADGIILGRIPRCPNCFGGRPKFDFKAGTYHCSGYRDDEQFKNCHTTFQLSEIKRDPWQ